MTAHNQLFNAYWGNGMSHGNKGRQHTAHYLVSRFLNSRESLEFDISSTDCHVLRYLADLIDMTNSYSGIMQCKIPLVQATTFSRISRATIQRSIDHLLKLNLLSIVTRASGVVATYALGDNFNTCLTVMQDNLPQNNSLPHHEAAPASYWPEPASPRGTSNKASNKSYKKEQGDASGSSPPSVDNYLDKQSFQFTPGEMTEAIQRDIHIQPCFDKFYDHIVNKGRNKFKRKEWETWFARETNGRRAKLSPRNDNNAPMEQREPIEKKPLGEHYERQMEEHRVIKRAPMPDSLRSLIQSMKRGL